MHTTWQRWVVPAAEILTVGLPFCVFKVLTGAIAVASPSVAVLGYGLLVMGAIDTLLNLVNLVGLLALRRRIAPVCLTALVLRARPDLGLAIDVFLSFALVALVIGAGLFARLPSGTPPIWNLAVVLNVLGAGTGRLFSALRRPAT